MPVSLLIPTQFPNHLHQHLMDMFHLLIDLGGGVWQTSHLLNAHAPAQLADDVVLKVGSSVTWELGWCSKDQDLALPQKFSNSCCHLTMSHICHDMSPEVVAEDQTIHYMWGLV